MKITIDYEIELGKAVLEMAENVRKLAERVEALEKLRSDTDLGYCTCGDTETWFDRSMTTE